MTKKRKLFISIMAIIMVVVLVLGLLVGVIGSTALAVSQSEIDALKEKRSAITEEKDKLQTQIDELQEEQSSVLDKKAALDIQNELARQEIELIDEQLDIYEGLLENKAKELEAAKEKESEQTDAYRTRIRAMEENNTLTYLSILFNADSFADFLTRLHDINDVLKYDQELEENYIEARQEVESVQAEFEEIQAEQEAAQSEMTEKKADLEKQIEEACEMIADLDEDIEKYKEEYTINEEAENELDKEINELIAQQEKERAAAAAAAAAAAGTTVSEPSTATPSNAGLIWPTTSYTVSSKYGWRLHPIWKVQKFHAGIDISVSYGQPIYAAASGTVTVATLSSSYGNYVMINHGNGLYTLYAHMSSMAVSAGASVTQGQVIGYVGSTGWSTGPHLHYEVRVNGSTTDPQSYY